MKTLLITALILTSVNLIANENELSNDQNLQIERPTLRELTDEEALEYLNEGPEDGLYTKILTIPKKPLKPFEEINILDLDEVSLVKLRTKKLRTNKAAAILDPINKINNIIMVTDKLVALGQKIIPLVKAGEAVLTNSPMSAITVGPIALSKEIVNGTMENWSSPKSRSFTLDYKGVAGNSVAKLMYKVSFQYGGTYNGKGAYLTGLRVIPVRIDLKYGHNLDVKSNLVSITNVGSNGEVIAGAEIQIEYTVKNFARVSTNVDSFFITGEGRIEPQQ